jgi:hypothetical protein
MGLLKSGACFTEELELNCPTIVGCVTALPVGPAAVAGTTQVLGKDGQFHALPAAPVATVPALSVSGNQLTIAGGNTVTLPDNDTQDLSISGNVISLTNGGSVTLPTTAAPAAQTLSISGQNLTISGGNTVALPAGASTVFATPAETVAGTSSTLAVNPADLVARENIPAQTGVSNNVTAIPAPTAGQSPWATNLLGEQLHYEPGVGWKVVADRFSKTLSLAANFTPPAQATITDFPGMSFVMPRAGIVDFTVSQLAASQFSNASIYLMKNGALFSRFGGLAQISNASFNTNALDFSGAAGDVTVAAGDVFSLSGQWLDHSSGPGTFNFNASLSRFTMQYQ